MRQFKFLQAFSPLFYSDKTYFLIYSGRSAGKSYNISAYLLLKLMSNEPNRIVVARYTAKSITSSIYQDILDHIENWGIGKYLKVTGDQIINTLNGNILLTHSVKISDTSQSARSKGLADCNILFVDECYELPSEEEYIKLSDTFRTKNKKIQIILAWNPGSKSHWIFKRWFLPDGSPNIQRWGSNHEFIYTSYKDNLENINPVKIKEWDEASITDPEYYNHHILGHWREIGRGQVFTHFKWEWNPPEDGEIMWGLDWGFSKDPTTLIKVIRKGKTLWLEEIIYQTGLTIEDLSNLMDTKGIHKDTRIICDSSEPRSIETMKRFGWRNIVAAKKGPDSIRHGIDKIKSYEVFANPMSENLKNEYSSYVYQEGTDRPNDKNNHIVSDALRYALEEVGGDSQYAFSFKRKNPWESMN